MATFDTAALVARVRRLARAPASSTSAAGWADADVLDLANHVLAGMVAQLLLTKAELFVTPKDYTLVAGTAAYALPARAVLGKVREVQLVASDGTVLDLPIGTPERLDGYDTGNGTPAFHYFRGNNVVLCPAPDATAYTTLRVHYFRRPNRLVTTAECMAITGVGSAPQYGGVSLAGFTGAPLDVVSKTAPFESLSDDNTPASVNAGVSVTFSAAITGAAVGDYVCLAGEAPVLQLPTDYFHLLAQRVAVRMLSGGSDAPAYEQEKAELQAMEAALFGAAVAGGRNEGDAMAIRTRGWAD